MTTFKEYLETNRKSKVKAEINERWLTRVVPKNLNEMGLKGAEQYLADYGQGIMAPKVIQLALKAEIENCPEMALGFWLKAYELETGQKADPSEYEALVGSTAAASSPSTPLKKVEEPQPSNFPKHLQPGKLITMQPVDAPNPREYYIDSPLYLGQPKRDGTRLVVFVEDGRVSYQSRTMSLRKSPSPELDEVFRSAANSVKNGEYILDGELTYLDWHSGEHRSAAQAAQINSDEEYSAVQPALKYCLFEALNVDGEDLTRQSKLQRIEAGKIVYNSIQQSDMKKNLVEYLPAAVTKEEKLALCKTQQTESREGEVWTLINTPYVGGKTKGREIPTVRTKYLMSWELVVTGLTPKTVEGRAFGAIEVARQEEGGQLTPMGSVGTGFTLEEMNRLASRFKAKENGILMIKVTSQGLTENGQLRHARYDGLPEEE
jgi:ATP-dependent DNA ligase